MAENGKMAKWQNGKMAKWQNGKMAKWQNGKRTLVIPSLLDPLVHVRHHASSRCDQVLVRNPTAIPLLVPVRSSG